MLAVIAAQTGKIWRGWMRIEPEASKDRLAMYEASL
jgi:hypothetical protein